MAGEEDDAILDEALSDFEDHEEEAKQQQFTPPPSTENIKDAFDNLFSGLGDFK